jgi:hypothetical protein
MEIKEESERTKRTVELEIDVPDGMIILGQPSHLSGPITIMSYFTGYRSPATIIDCGSAHERSGRLSSIFGRPE